MRISPLSVLRQAAIVVLLVCRAEASLPDSPAPDDFSERMQLLEEQDATEVGRDVKIAGYKRLLEDYPRHPQRAKAMLKIADLWDITIPALQIRPDKEKVIAWLWRAREAARPGSKDWYSAQFMLAGRVRRQDAKLARRLLEEALRFARDPVIETKTLYRLQMVATLEGNLEEAERICVRLQEWPRDDSRMPDKSLDKAKVLLTVQSSARSMMITWIYMDAPRAVRAAKMKEFAKKYRTQYNQRLLEEMEALLATMNLPGDVDRVP